MSLGHMVRTAVTDSDASPERIVVLLSSPGDVRDAKDRVDDVVRDVDSLSRNVGLSLCTWRYERDATPGVDDENGDAQLVVSRQMPLDYDLYVGIMCRRVGTPTGRARSGTIEELQAAIDQRRASGKPEIFFYFCSAERDDGDAEVSEVLRFQRDFPGLFYSFDGVDDLARQFKHHLLMWLFRRRLNASKPSYGHRREWVSVVAAEVDRLGSQRQNGYLDRTSRRGTRLFAKLSQLFDLNGALSSEERDALLLSTHLLTAAQVGGVEAVRRLVQEVEPALHLSAAVIDAARCAARLLDNGTEPPAELLATGSIRGDLISALLKIGRRFELDRSAIAARHQRLDPDESADLAEWLARLTREVRILGGGVPQFVLEAPGGEWVEPLRRCTALGLEAEWQALRVQLASAGLTLTVARSEVLLSDRPAPPDSVLRRLRTAAKDVEQRIPAFPHLGDKKPPVEIEMLVPLPGSTIAEGLRVAGVPNAENVLTLNPIGGGDRVVAESYSGSISLDGASLVPGTEYRWTLTVDYGTGQPEVVAAGTVRTLDERSRLLWAEFPRLEAATRAALRNRLGLHDERLRDVWPDLGKDSTSVEERLSVLGLLASALAWTDRHAPHTTRIESYRNAAGWVRSLIIREEMEES